MINHLSGLVQVVFPSAIDSVQSKEIADKSNQISFVRNEIIHYLEWPPAGIS